MLWLLAILLIVIGVGLELWQRRGAGVDRRPPPSSTVSPIGGPRAPAGPVGAELELVPARCSKSFPLPRV